MRYHTIWGLVALAGLSAGLGACHDTSTPVDSCDGLEAQQAWVVPSHSGSREMLGYFTLHNKGGSPVKINGISSHDFDRVLFQDKSQSSNDENGPRPLSSVTIAAGQTLAFKPGEKEVVLYSPTRGYHAGDQVKMQLSCGKEQDTLKIQATVRDSKGDLPDSDEDDKKDRRQIIEDGRSGGGAGAADDSRSAN